MSDETPHRFLRYSYGEEELFCFLFDSLWLPAHYYSAAASQDTPGVWGKTCKNRREVSDGKSDRNLLITPSVQSRSWWACNKLDLGAQLIVRGQNGYLLHLSSIIQNARKNFFLLIWTFRPFCAFCNFDNCGVKGIYRNYNKDSIVCRGKASSLSPIIDFYNCGK